MKLFRHLALLALVAGIMSAPAKVLACAACYGPSDDAMAHGMNWAILTLGVVVATVLGTFLTFLIYIIRRSEALEAAAQKKALEPAKI